MACYLLLQEAVLHTQNNLSNQSRCLSVLTIFLGDLLSHTAKDILVLYQNRISDRQASAVKVLLFLRETCDCNSTFNRKVSFQNEERSDQVVAVG